MGYDEFNDSPFDLNHDGNIDSSEASFIEDTYYEDHNGISTGFEEDDDSYVSYGTSRKTGYSSINKTEEQKRKELDEALEGHAVMAVIYALVIMGILIFVGNNIIGVVVFLAFYGVMKLIKQWK